MDNIEYQPKSNEEYITFLHLFQVLKVLLYKNLYNTTTRYIFLFLDVFIMISFYLSRYRFSQN